MTNEVKKTEEVTGQETVLEGEHQAPQQSVKLFNSTTELGSWLTLTKPKVISVQSGVQEGKQVYQLITVRTP